jgi:hypothetical protein
MGSHVRTLKGISTVLDGKGSCVCGLGPLTLNEEAFQNPIRSAVLCALLFPRGLSCMKLVDILQGEAGRQVPWLLLIFHQSQKSLAVAKASARE